MAITINVYRSARSVVAHGAIQKTNTVDFATRNPFFVTLRSVGVETFNSTDSGLLRNANTGTYSTEGANELSTANGYIQGGKSLLNTRLLYSSGALTLYADDLAWLATGSGITAKSALLCYEFPAPRQLAGQLVTDPYVNSCAVAMIDFDGTKTAVAGTALTLQWPAAGILKWELS